MMIDFIEQALILLLSIIIGILIALFFALVVYGGMILFTDAEFNDTTSVSCND